MVMARYTSRRVGPAARREPLSHTMTPAATRGLDAAAGPQGGVMLNIAGSNPWTVTYAPPPGLKPPWRMAAVRWRIVAVTGCACLDRQVTPVAGSGIPLTIQEPEYDASGALTGYREEARSAPQAIKVALACGECTCGGRFSVTVHCDVGTFVQLPITALTTEITTLSLHCAGPGCEGTIVIQEEPLAAPLEKKPQQD